MIVSQYVYFALSSERVSAAEITARLGIEPDEIVVRGSRVASPARPGSHRWKITCRKPGLTVDEQITAGRAARPRARAATCPRGHVPARRRGGHASRVGELPAVAGLRLVRLRRGRSGSRMAGAPSAGRGPWVVAVAPSHRRRPGASRADRRRDRQRPSVCQGRLDVAAPTAAHSHKGGSTATGWRGSAGWVNASPRRMRHGAGRASTLPPAIDGVARSCRRLRGGGCVDRLGEGRQSGSRRRLSRQNSLPSGSARTCQDASAG
ncbi:DUF4279 domain-containing protein [Micromonospora purpureochromogenes]|uniref:DUF4279 domain-containing protein n=1 Tax=Micromonospora purpureochromogenes TaxID=47872 RepID=UPI0033C3D4AC